LFNKAPPCEFDPFFSEHHRQHRKLQQVASYHDLDGIPTVPAHPGMKGFGGCSKSSPNSVTDVKHFVTAHFENDCGGVSIDLCVEDDETDEYDEDQVQALQQERQDEHQQLAHQEPCTRPRTSSPRTTTLAPIFEERRVTFAAQHVVLKVEEAADSLAIETQSKFVHQVFDAIQVWFIPHHSEYTEEVRSRLWYNPSEMAFMKEQASEAKKTRRRHQRSLQRSNQRKKQRCESQIDTCSLFTFDLKKEATKASSVPTNTKLSTSQRRSLYETMVDAVLTEQYEQRLKCLKVYGRIDEGCTGILDSNRLAEVCATAGDTQRSLERALQQAQTTLEENQDEDSDGDELLTKHHRHCDSMELTTEAMMMAVSANVRGSKKTSSGRSKQVKRATSTFHSSAMFTVETSQILDQSVVSVFRTLLSPFLEIREGDAFLGIGEEMSIA